MSESFINIPKNVIKYIKLGILCFAIMLAGWGIFYLSQNPILLKQENMYVELKNKYNPREAISYVFFGKDKDVEVETNVDTKKIGMYKTKYTYRGYTIEVNVEVRDTKPPILDVKNYTASMDEEVNVEAFVVRVKDDTEVKTEIDYMEKKQENVYNVVIKATDEGGNVTKKEATLTRVNKK